MDRRWPMSYWRTYAIRVATSQHHHSDPTRRSARPIVFFWRVYADTRNIQILRISGYGESQINATALRHLWHVRCLTPQRAVVDAARDLSFAELSVLAAPEESGPIRASAPDEVRRWLETRANFNRTSPVSGTD